ncbi:NERD domain-containing protein [Salicibibacter cibarius]|uniref:NERD domain-containing protein n=1 Tax=Salicibibacter cibarius TaxID=2743000 RepID=A0A7T7CA83_9BACI|nr:nuclease-related domain-containing protein [Salicibibacter cibarius]QQK74624.1 NERD domain-containing protein [Salicibibacter cibarius]
MNTTPRAFPVKIRQLEALESRLSPAHKEFSAIKTEVKRSRAGWRGEISMDYFYSQLDLPRQHYFVHQLRLPRNMGFFQMDTLLLTKYFFLILEIKNLAGTLTFDHEHQQLLRTQGDQQEVFADPVLQAQQQAASLKAWLHAHYSSSPPIYTYAVMTNENSVLRNAAPHPLHRQIIRPPALRQILQDFFAKERCHSLNAEVNTYVVALKKAHRPAIFSAMEKYELSRVDLKNGVFCPVCACIMEWRHGKWVCSRCGHVSRDAHRKALEDYALLVSPHITSGECQTYLHLPVINTAQRLLQKMNLTHSGGTKARKYHLEALIKAM